MRRTRTLLLTGAPSWLALIAGQGVIGAPQRGGARDAGLKTRQDC